MTRSLRIVKKTSSLLILDRPRFASFLEGTFLSGFVFCFYYVIYSIFKNYAINKYLQVHSVHSVLDAILVFLKEDNLHISVLLFMSLGLIVFIPIIYLSFKNAIYGERFEFNTSSGMALRNSELFLRINDVDKIQIRAITDSEGDSMYRLSLIMKNGDKKFIDSTSSQNDIYSLADDLADLLGVHIIHKS